MLCVQWSTQKTKANKHILTIASFSRHQNHMFYCIIIYYDTLIPDYIRRSVAQVLAIWPHSIWNQNHNLQNRISIVSRKDITPKILSPYSLFEYGMPCTLGCVFVIHILYTGTNVLQHIFICSVYITCGMRCSETCYVYMTIWERSFTAPESQLNVNERI